MGNRCLAHFPVHFAGCRPTHAPLGAQRNWRRDESSRRLHHGREERGTLPWSRVGIPMTLCVCARAPSPVQTSIGRDGTADCLVEEKLRWRRAAPHSSTRSVPAQVYPTPRSSLPCNNRGIEQNASDGKPSKPVILLEGSMQRGRQAGCCVFVCSSQTSICLISLTCSSQRHFRLFPRGWRLAFTPLSCNSPAKFPSRHLS